MQTQPFTRHDRRWYAPRPSWKRQATINGKPAWLVAEERKKEQQDEQ